MVQKSFNTWVADNEMLIEDKIQKGETLEEARDRLYLDYEESWFELHN